jgi:hypothetical protein
MIDTPTIPVSPGSVNRNIGGPYVVVPEQLYEGQPTGSNATLYTAPAAPTNPNSVGLTPRVRITEIWAANNDTTDRTLTLYLVESGGTAAANRCIIPAVNIPAGRALQIPCSTVIKESGTIQGLASSAATITLVISGEIYHVQ